MASPEDTNREHPIGVLLAAMHVTNHEQLWLGNIARQPEDADHGGVCPPVTAQPDA